ncbi:hypothetical protein Pmani_022675 [Petrolisthes manimaculis]|uniref:Uncharacterized protein n=1 Tax=Petrolisthes manimaculis TaxID=1843537 RepID=A0AAE1PCA3_9EUCA|nr:hypothetical protein Pmani_022675 [Petrolisthes manimaculis]
MTMRGRHYKGGGAMKDIDRDEKKGRMATIGKERKMQGETRIIKVHRKTNEGGSRYNDKQGNGDAEGDKGEMNAA